MQLTFDPSSIDDYRRFIAVRQLPAYKFHGRVAHVPDEFAHMLGGSPPSLDVQYCPTDGLFDYQRDIARLAIGKRKFAIFADCGLGKTLMLLEFAQHARQATGKKVLIVSPLMVCEQTITESVKWYGDRMGLTYVASKDLPQWLNARDGIAITNYEAIRDGLDAKDLGGLILDESSMLKSHYGRWGTRLIELGKGVEFKLCSTGTPAPNDRIEFANHAVFLDRAKTVNEFLATYFVNRGETQNRWELKPHALRPFYRSLSAWSIFLTNPATYGWADNVETLPPINIQVHDVPLTDQQRRAAQELTGNLITTRIGGIGERGKLSQIAKGTNGVETNKPAYIRDMIDTWRQKESTIVWCQFNAEQDRLADVLPDSVSVTGSTPAPTRQRLIDDFKSGRVKTLITKPKILGFGLNLQVATRQVFSGIKDSYEEFYQAVKRSNRIGSEHPLSVHIPVTELEVPFVENVLSKADRVESDSREQEMLFKEVGYGI